MRRPADAISIHVDSTLDLLFSDWHESCDIYTLYVSPPRNPADITLDRVEPSLAVTGLIVDPSFFRLD